MLMCSRECTKFTALRSFGFRIGFNGIFMFCCIITYIMRRISPLILTLMNIIPRCILHIISIGQLPFIRWFMNGSITLCTRMHFDVIYYKRIKRNFVTTLTCFTKMCRGINMRILICLYNIVMFMYPKTILTFTTFFVPFLIIFVPISYYSMSDSIFISIIATLVTFKF
jgi:hypothetical protein